MLPPATVTFRCNFADKGSQTPRFVRREKSRGENMSCDRAGPEPKTRADQRRERVDRMREATGIIGTNRALNTGTRPRGARSQCDARPTERVVNAQFSDAMLAEMMDCSSKLALRIGDQLKSAAKAEKDRQERPHLQPVEQQANCFVAHFSLIGARVLGMRQLLLDAINQS